MANEIWIADFEYISRDGNNPVPICFCAQELNTGRKIRQWLYDVKEPIAPFNFKDVDLTYVSFFAPAEISCHLQLGWDIPENIIDLFCEWRVYTNDGVKHEKGYNSLLNACLSFGIQTIETEQKRKMRERILQGAPYTNIEVEEILDYCETDIIETIELFKAMRPLIDNWQRALFRGRYMALCSKMEHNGVSLDVPTYNIIVENWDMIKYELLKEVKKEFDFFDGLTFKTQVFANYLNQNSMAWPVTEKGNLEMKGETWKKMVQVYPQLQPVGDIKALLDTFKKFQIVCGADGRNRGMLSPFGTKTGRNAPKISCVFTNSAWMRHLIKPEFGKTLAYVDFEQQEFFIAAILSNDLNMIKTYQTGDPYLFFAKQAGAIPQDGTKETYKAVRDIYKLACLGIQYGMRAESLAISINRPVAYAHEILRQHKRLFPHYWTWQNETLLQAKLSKQICTLYGWKMQVLTGTSKEDMTLGNFLMQSTGADILRIATYLLDEAGIKIVAPVHDALMIEVDATTADQDITKAETIMHNASKIVLGQPLRTETLRIDFPDRYHDKRGKTTWDRVIAILEGIAAGTIQPDYEAMGSKWLRHASKLEKASHGNLLDWTKGIDADLIDKESLTDSLLSATENRKNIKGMWREHL